jgi:hypothetical protein
MQFFKVQAAMTDQFTVEQQNRDLVAVARLAGRFAIDIDHFNSDCRRFGHRREFEEHLLAQAAAGA